MRHAMDIPSVTELYKLLGYPIGGCTILKTTTQSWRKDYVCKDGTSGLVLRKWASSKDRDDLRQMSIDFLEHDENKFRFWPSRRSSSLPDRPRCHVDYDL